MEEDMERFQLTPSHQRKIEVHSKVRWPSVAKAGQVLRPKVRD